MNGTRTLKVGELWRTNRFSESFFPKINLQGKWLREAGFAIGDEIYVILDEPGRLVIIASQEYSKEVQSEIPVSAMLQPKSSSSLRGGPSSALCQLPLFGSA
jgi:hypothetical protein